jgi:maleylpyruvate isomerase
VIFYDYWRSSSAWRVRIALHLKGIAFERRVVNLVPGRSEQLGADFKTLNPLSQVPVLIPAPGARPIAQSMAIIAYLEEQFPEPALLPADPWLRARARQLAEMINAGIQPLQNLATLDRVKAAGADANAWAAHFTARGLEALETAATDTAATFLIGEAPTLPDLYLVPQLYNARRWSVDVARYPRLLQAESACARLPAFQAAHADAQSDKPAAPAG